MVAIVDASRFFKVYANLPIKIREEIIAVIDGEPISWNVAYKEIIYNTEKAKKILEKLDKLGVI